MTETALTSLLSDLVDRGLLHADATEKVRWMCAQGVHPEQALIGTGLVQMDAYAEALSKLHDLPFLRLTSATPRRDLPEVVRDAIFEQHEAWPLALEEKSLGVGFADPSNEHQRAMEKWARHQGWKLYPHVILRSDWRRAAEQTMTPSKPVGRTMRVIQSIIRTSDPTHVHVFDEHGQGAVVFGSRTHAVPSFSIPSYALPSLILQLKRHAEREGFQMDEHVFSNGSGLSIERRSEEWPKDHPATWMENVQSFLEDPEGMCVLEGLDAHHRQTLLDEVEEGSSEDWRGSQNVSWFDGDVSSGREQAEHLALAGRPVVACTSSSHPFWQTLADAGVPVTVVKATRLPEGVAFHSHRY